MTSRAFSLRSTAWVATYTLRRHQLSCVAPQRLTQLIVDAASRRLQACEALLALSAVVRFVKIGFVELVLWISQD